MSAAPTTFQLVWPREVGADQVAEAVRALTGQQMPVSVEALGRYGRVEHRITVPSRHEAGTAAGLRTNIPGIGLEPADTSDDPDYTAVFDIGLSTSRRPLRTDRLEAASRNVLTKLALAGKDEAISLRWTATDRLRAERPPRADEAVPPESASQWILDALLRGNRPLDSGSRTALADKRREAGARIVGQLAVRAATEARIQQLANGVFEVLRLNEGQGAWLALKRRPLRTLHRTPRHGPISLNASEFAGLIGWPAGTSASLPVISQAARRLPASAAIPDRGLVIGRSTWPGSDRPLALSPEDATRHLHVLGPTGTGKSTLMLNLICQDMAAGRGLVVIDPKGDLVRGALARMPDERRGDVVVVSAADSGGGEHVVGINPLAGQRGRSPEASASELMEIFAGLYRATFGVRTADILGAALRTLAKAGGHSLASVPHLLTDKAFRQRLTAGLQWSFGETEFWAEYDAWSEAERVTNTAPVLRRLRPFLAHSGIRRIVAQTAPRFDFGDVFARRRIVLVDLSKGTVGPEAAQLLGALVLAQLWQAAQARSSVPPEHRAPVTAYLDEFQEYLSLPLSLEDALAEARGLGLGFVLAHQHLKQLPADVRSAVLANARSRVCFQPSPEDAAVLARDSVLEAEDFRGLDAFHFYAQLVAGNRVQPWCSGRLLMSPEPHTDPEGLRVESAARYGTPGVEVDLALWRRLHPGGSTAPAGDDDVAPQRREKQP